MVRNDYKIQVQHPGSIKILHIISGDLWAGAEVQVYNTLSFLKKNKNIELVCILFNAGVLKERLAAIGVKTIVLDEMQCNNFSLLISLIKTIHDINPDIIHVHRVKEHLFSKIYAIGRRHQIPIVRTIHGLRSASRKLPLKQFVKSSLAVESANWLIKYFTDVIIAVSKDLEMELINSGVKGTIYQLYNSINADDYINLKDKEDIRKRHGASNLFWIGTAARLVEVKNLSMLIDAGKYLNENDIPFKISIFGEGPLENALKDLIIKNDLVGKVELPGFENNILPIIESLDVFVLPSHHEGLPMSILEAMMLKIPVVCTKVGGMAEIIENEVNGLLVPPDDSRELADCILKLYKYPDLVHTLTENARQSVENKFSLSKTTEMLFNIYYEAIAKAARR